MTIRNLDTCVLNSEHLIGHLNGVDISIMCKCLSLRGVRTYLRELTNKNTRTKQALIK